MNIKDILSTGAATACARCSLSQARTQVVLPDGAAGSLLAVGEAPGQREDELGEGFVGVAGKNLDRVLAQNGFGRSDYARANIVRCRPPGNRKPKAAEISACSSWLVGAISLCAPTVILAVGESAARGLVTDRWRSYLDYVDSVIRGFQSGGIGSLPVYGAWSTPVVPMPHTSPLAWNRRRPGGEPIRCLGERAVFIACQVNRSER